MISKETAYQIAYTYDQIKNAQELISDMGEVLERNKEKTFPDLESAFGEKRGLELGVPSGNNGHRLFNVSPELSIKVIEDHIKTKRTRLVELMAIAKIELYKD